MKVHVLRTVPGATDSVRWEDICHQHETFAYVTHLQTRQINRWRFLVRKRPFIVCIWTWGAGHHHNSERSSHFTLEAALVAANKIASASERTQAVG